MKPVFLILALLMATSCRPRSGVEIRDAWARPAARMNDSSVTPSAVYARIINHESTPVNLTCAVTTVAGTVEMHRSFQQNGVMRMRRVDTMEVPPGREIRLQPGGNHIMLMHLTNELLPGNEFELSLITGKGDTIKTTVPVKDQ